jgi:nucleotide-binding universal stress UspA family protein
MEIPKDHDIIVMVAPGRTGISKLLPGCAAEKVVRPSDCPVLVVSERCG